MPLQTSMHQSATFLGLPLELRQDILHHFLVDVAHPPANHASQICVRNQLTVLNTVFGSQIRYSLVRLDASLEAELPALKVVEEHDKKGLKQAEAAWDKYHTISTYREEKRTRHREIVSSWRLWG